MDLSTLTALTWVMLIAAALFALMLPAKESTGVMLALLLIGDAIALWAYRRDANTAILRRLVPSVLAGVGLGALLLAVSTQAPMHRAIGAILLLLIGALAPIVLACAWAGRRLAAHIPPAHLRAPRHRHDDRGDSAAVGVSVGICPFPITTPSSRLNPNAYHSSTSKGVMSSPHESVMAIGSPAPSDLPPPRWRIFADQRETRPPCVRWHDLRSRISDQVSAH